MFHEIIICFVPDLTAWNADYAAVPVPIVRGGMGWNRDWCRREGKNFLSKNTSDLILRHKPFECLFGFING